MGTIAIDWDDTLVGYKKYGTKGEWLPGAQEGLKALLKSKRHVVIHSCRGSFSKGLQEINDLLHSSGFTKFLLTGSLRIWVGEGKPLAMVYLDDRALHFDGEDMWQRELVLALKEMTRP